MVSSPSLLILDEPTSGLDSNKAAKVLKILKKLAGHGHTIVFTIHQPSYLLYQQLDRLILLDRGETIYQGSSSKIKDYMIGLGVQVPNTSTISDLFMMEISAYKQQTQKYSSPFNADNYQTLIAPKI